MQSFAMQMGRRRFACSALALAAAGPASAEPVAFERPRTLLALLQNMKRAAQEQRLRDEAFYAEENLKQAFAGTNVTLGSRVDAYRLYGRVWGFGVLVSPVLTGATAREGIDLTFSLSSTEGALRLVCLQPTLPFDKIEDAFGKAWKHAPYPGPSGGALLYATRPHGSSAIAYALNAEASTASLTFSFNARALLETAVALAH